MPSWPLLLGKIDCASMKIPVLFSRMRIYQSVVWMKNISFSIIALISEKNKYWIACHLRYFKYPSWLFSLRQVTLSSVVKTKMNSYDAVFFSFFPSMAYIHWQWLMDQYDSWNVYLNAFIVCSMMHNASRSWFSYHICESCNNIL